MLLGKCHALIAISEITQQYTQAKQSSENEQIIRFVSHLYFKHLILITIGNENAIRYITDSAES